MATAPICPSSPGSNTTSSFVVLHALSSTAPARAIYASTRLFPCFWGSASASCGLSVSGIEFLLLHLYEEGSTTYPQNGRARLHLHRILGTMGNMARDHGQGATFNLGEKFSLLRCRIKGKFLQGDLTVWPQRETRIINKSYANAAVCACHQRIGFFEQIARFSGRLHSIMNNRHITGQGFDLPNGLRPRCLAQRRRRYEHRPDYDCQIPV